MTVPVPSSLTYAYVADGVTTVFPYPVRFLEANELLVLHEAADGSLTELGYNVGYTVSGAGNPSGGSITTLSVITEGRVLISRRTTAKQLVDLADNARNPAEAVEQQLDRMVMTDQDLGRGLAQAFKAPLGEDGGIIYPIAEDHFYKTDADGNLIDGGSATDIANAQANAAAAAADAERAEQAANEAQAAVLAAVGGNFPTRTLLKAAVPITPTLGKAAYLHEEGREGKFRWRAGDYTAQVAGDPLEGLYIESSVTGFDRTIGAWVRIVDDGFYTPEMFGCTPISDLGAALAAMYAVLTDQSQIRLRGAYTYTTDAEAIGKGFHIDAAGVRITNNLDKTTYPDTTVASIFKFSGSRALIGTTSAVLNRGALTFTSSATIAVGDILAFTGGAGPYAGAVNIHKVKGVSGTTITMDRPAHTEIASGADIYKVTPVKASVKGPLYIDFNGTVASPRFGYGVFITLGVGCVVRDIDSDYCGSMPFIGSACMDCLVENVNGSNGTELTGGGHSYVTRWATGNDNKSINCIGTNMRHVIDMSGSSRNTIVACKGHFNFSTDFLTHFNGCVDNTFIDCESWHNITSAYSFDANNGDKYNRVIGGRVVNTSLTRDGNDGTNTFTGVVYESYAPSTKAMLAPVVSSTWNFYGCVFHAGVAMVQSGGSSGTIRINFDRCTFEAEAVARAIISLPVTTATYVIVFNNCVIRSKHDGSIIEGSSTVTFIFNNTDIETSGAPASSSASLVYPNGGRLEINGGKWKWGVSGAGCIISANTGSVIQIKQIEVENATTSLIRRVGGTPELQLGDVILNTVPFTASNMAVTSTFGKMANLGYTAVPASGAFSDGVEVRNGAAAAGGYMGWRRISGAWKGAGLIEA